MYPPEVIAALQNYRHHLINAQQRLKERERMAEEDLRRYDSAGKEMKAIVVKYTQILTEMETVSADIKKLGGNS
jgi:HAUS augmin-like complex subunit 4